MLGRSPAIWMSILDETAISRLWRVRNSADKQIESARYERCKTRELKWQPRFTSDKLIRVAPGGRVAHATTAFRSTFLTIQVTRKRWSRFWPESLRSLLS